MRDFHVGQEVVCVDPGEPANPWHRAHPLIKGKHYVIHGIRPWRHATNGTSGVHVQIDNSGRCWNPESFRPLRFDPIDVDRVVYTPVKEGRGELVKGVRVRICVPPWQGLGGDRFDRFDDPGDEFEM